MTSGKTRGSEIYVLHPVYRRALTYPTWLILVSYLCFVAGNASASGALSLPFSRYVFSYLAISWLALFIRSLIFGSDYFEKEDFVEQRSHVAPRAKKILWFGIFFVFAGLVPLVSFPIKISALVLNPVFWGWARTLIIISAVFPLLLGAHWTSANFEHEFAGEFQFRTFFPALSVCAMSFVFGWSNGPSPDNARIFPPIASATLIALAWLSASRARQTDKRLRFRSLVHTLFT